MPTTPPTLNTPPADTPIRGQRSTFSDRLDAFITWLVAACPQYIALALNVYNNALEAFNSADSANTAKLGAEAAQSAAAATANVTKWITGTNYAEGVCTWSPTDYKTYRRKAPGGVSVTDPAADSAGWTAVGSTSGITSANVETLAADKVLNSSSPKLQILTATTFGRILKFPAANTLTVADPALTVINDGDYPIGITNGADQLFGQILPGDKIVFALPDTGSVAGIWRADGNLDPWFVTAEVGATVYNGGNQIKISDTASWIYYQNSNNYPCVRYLSHPADGSLALGNEYVLDAASASVLTSDSFAMGATRYVFALSSGKYVLVDYTSAPTLSVGAAVTHGLGGSWAQGRTLAFDSQYFAAFSANTASGRYEVLGYDCGASGTTITKGNGGTPQTATGYGTTSLQIHYSHKVDSTTIGIFAQNHNGTYVVPVLRSITRSGGNVSWNADAAAPAGIRTEDGSFSGTLYTTSQANVFFWPHYGTSSNVRFVAVTFATTCSYGAPVASTNSYSSAPANWNCTKIGTSAYIIGGSVSTFKLEHVGVSGTTCTPTLSALVDGAATSGTMSVQAASVTDGKGIVGYTISGSKTKYAAFAVSGPTINYGSTKWESASGSSSNAPFGATSWGFLTVEGTTGPQRFVQAQMQTSGTTADQVATIATLTIDTSGNPTLGAFGREIDHAVINTMAPLSSDRVAISCANSASSRYVNGVSVGGKLKFGRAPFRRGDLQSGATITGGAHVLGVRQTDHRFGRNFTLNRYRFAEVYA